MYHIATHNIGLGSHDYFNRSFNEGPFNEGPFCERVLLCDFKQKTTCDTI